MMGFLFFFVLFGFTLILQEIHGSGTQEDNLYGLFHKVNIPDGQDIPIYWTEEGPSLQPSISFIMEEFVNYHSKGMLKWPELTDTWPNHEKWSNFCILMWNLWKVTKKHLIQNCDYSTYLAELNHDRNAIKVLIGGEKGNEIKISVNLLACNCEYLGQGTVRTKEKIYDDAFYVARGNKKEFFILKKKNDNPKMRTLVVCDYKTDINYW